MKGVSKPSAQLEVAIQNAALAIYGPQESMNFAAAGDVIRTMLAEDARNPGDRAQQIAVGTIISDMTPVTEEEADADGGSGDATAERVMTREKGEYVLDGMVLARIAAGALRERKAVREQVMAYCAIRFCHETPSESGEMHAVAAAREALKEGSAVTDLLTRVYSRRVLALIAEDSGEVVDAIRQASEEGSPLEAVRLAEASYARLEPDGAMSVLALGITAASDLENRAQELSLVGALADVICRHFHQLHHASPSDAEFAQDERALALAGEMDVIADRLAREEDCGNAFAIIVGQSAVAYALLGREILARAALERLQRFAGGRPGGLCAEAAALAETTEALLNGGDDGAPEHVQPPDEPDPDDPRKDPANWWKNN